MGSTSALNDGLHFPLRNSTTSQRHLLRGLLPLLSLSLFQYWLQGQHELQVSLSACLGTRLRQNGRHCSTHLLILSIHELHRFQGRGLRAKDEKNSVQTSGYLKEQLAAKSTSYSPVAHKITVFEAVVQGNFLPIHRQETAANHPLVVRAWVGAELLTCSRVRYFQISRSSTMRLSICLWCQTSHEIHITDPHHTQLYHHHHKRETTNVSIQQAWGWHTSSAGEHKGAEEAEEAEGAEEAEWTSRLKEETQPTWVQDQERQDIGGNTPIPP